MEKGVCVGMMMRLLWIVVMTFGSTVEGGGISLSKLGCPQKCGNVTIPYPFGVAPKCSYNASFALTCNYTTNPPKPYLKVRGMRLQVVEIWLESKVIRVNQAVSPLICSSNTTFTPLRTISLVGSPFTFTGYLAVVGCDSEVRLMDSRTSSSTPLGCRPSCGSALGCYGINCCQISLTLTASGPVQELAIQYRTFEQGRNVCGLAVLVDYTWLRIDYRNRSGSPQKELDMSLQYAPMALTWIFNDLPVQTQYQGVLCYNSSYDFSPSLDNNYTNRINTSRCYCDDGFQGNPYLRCHDINECTNATLNNCTAGTTCVNTIGSFRCDPLHENNQMKTMITVISSGAGALLLLTGACFSSKLIRKRIKANRRNKFFKRNGGLLLQQQLSSNDSALDKMIKLFSSKELALATDHYNENRILGRGGQGTVYKGMLPDGRVVAVKKSKKMDEADIQAFINEVVILSQINHRNVVKLLGCCLETEVPLLVSEFIPNGTLFQHIHDHNDDYLPLSWKMRLRIAAQVAGVLSYLHNAASVPIYHRDIKSTNILLDEKYRAKVSDFGTSRSIALDQTHLTTRVLGTFGYLDPEYFQSSQFTEKSDVYSFGVVMVELLTGEKAISRVRAETGKSLASHFLQSMEEHNLTDILDPEILKEGRMEEIVAVAKLARRCLNLIGKRRPTMKAVAAELEGIQMKEDGTVSPLNNLEEMEFDSIEIREDYDFPCTSDSTNTTAMAADSSDSPLLYDKS